MGKDTADKHGWRATTWVSEDQQNTKLTIDESGGMMEDDGASGG
jgi:hypothetical protein